jgi:hypothetical protein
MFSRGDLDELVTADAQPAISIYLPTHPAGREIRQNPTRLKNLLSSAAERLAVSHRKIEVEALLAPAGTLVSDQDFLRHQEQGLAVFLAPGFDRVHRLPIAVPERMVSGSEFYIVPLLPLLDDAAPFWLLTISSKQTRLYQGSRWTFAEVPGVELPQGVDAIRRLTEYQETQYAMPTGRRGTLAHAQSLGEAPAELRKVELIEFLRQVAAAFEPHLKRDPAPVVLAADPVIRGHFSEIAGWGEIEPNGITENPDALRPEELRQKASALAEQKLAETRSAALDRLNSLLGTGKATTNPAEIVTSARHARVDHLFLSGDNQLWGRFDKAADQVIAHDTAIEGDVDLLNDAALMTLRQQGSVSAVAPRALPDASPAAAILRY